MPVRLQEWIHGLEEGAGFKYLQGVLAVILAVATAVAYDLAAFRNLTTREGMDTAQLAWNISEGRGFTTSFVRPFSVHLLRKHFSEVQAAAGSALSTNAPVAEGDSAKLREAHPDLANAPLYPTVLAGFFKVIQMTPPDLALQQGFKIYGPDFWIGVFNQLLLLLLMALVFFVARAWFDGGVAWAAAAVMLGSELCWRFTLSGLPTILLMLIVTSLAAVLARIEPMVREEKGSGRSLLLLAAAAGALTGLAGLTRYSFGWLIIPVVLWLTSLAGPKRATLALTALAAFLVVLAPWVARNYNLSGTPFGTAGYALFESTSQFPEDQLERSLAVDFSGVTSADFLQKLVGNGREILLSDLPRLWGSWISAFFLVGLLVPFRNPRLNRVRWFLVMSLGLVTLVQALGRTALTSETSAVHSENLLVVLAPLVFIYGAGLFFSLFEQAAGQFPAMRFSMLSIFCLVAWAPLLLNMLAPYPSPLVYPPYYPPWIQEKAWSVDKDGLIMSDMPWAVAWYGQRQSVELSLKHKNKAGDQLRNDFYEMDSLKPVNALYLGAKTLKALEPKLLWDWLRRDADAGLLNSLRQRVADNEGREEKKEEDFRLFGAVRERLVRNARTVEENGEDWEHFVLTTYLKSEVPTGFPLKRAPEGLFPELFLMDSERGRPKVIQSSK